MANYLSVYPATDSQIDFIVSYPETLWAFVEGELPEISSKSSNPSLWQRLTFQSPPALPTPQIPEDWPSGETCPIGPEINHRNVDLYHLILNGTADFVDGSGSIFQTWLSNSNHSAIDLTGDKDNFAFKSLQIPKLAELVAKVNKADVKLRFTQWLRANGDSHNPADDECAEIAEEFRLFAEEVQKAVDDTQGLIWISS